MKSMKKKRFIHPIHNKKGFTLAEMLLVVAIISILAGFGFVNVARYQKKLKLLEMDNTARELFVAMQNHLTELRTSGEWEQLLREKSADADQNGQTADSADDAYFGSSLDTASTGRLPDGEEIDTSEDPTGHDFYRIVYTPGIKQDSVLNRILPEGSLDETVRSGGSYIVEYDRTTAEIYAVFYSDLKSGFFSNTSGDPLTAEDADKLYGLGLKTESREDYLPTHASGRSKGIFVGYYGGAVNKDNGNPEENQPDWEPVVTAKLVNDETLYLDVSVSYRNRKTKETRDALPGGYLPPEISYTVIGETSGASHGGQFNYAATHRHTLDDITVQGQNFAAQYPELTPGENVHCKVSAVIRQGEQTSGSVEVSTNTENSLYASAHISKASDKGTYTLSEVSVSNGRQLENLSHDISNAGSVDSAKLTADLDWQDRYGSLNVYSFTGNQLTTASGQFVAINPEAAGSFTFSGEKHTLSNMTIHEGSSNKNVGLFGAFPDDVDVTMQNVKLQNVSIKDAMANSGALLGYKSEGKLSFSDISLDNTSISGSAGNYGGLAGAVSSPLLLRDIEAQDVSIQAVNAAGGLIGLCTGTEMADCYGDFAIGNLKIRSTAENAGGLFGSLEGSLKTYQKTVIRETQNSSWIISGQQGAGGLVAYAAGNVMLPKVMMDAKLSVTGAKYAGGLVGFNGGSLEECKDAAIIMRQELTITADGADGHAGGIVGMAGDRSTVTLQKISIGTDTPDTVNRSIIGVSSAGGIAGLIQGQVSLIDVSVSGKSFLISASVKNLTDGSNAGNADGSAGGLIGKTRQKGDALAIQMSRASVALRGDQDAGGLIGEAADGSLLIRESYAAGQTEGGAYQTGTALDGQTSNYNVISGGNAGGLIGSVNQCSLSELDTSYTTMSVYSSFTQSESRGQAAGAGGFIGSVNAGNLKLYKTYTASPVSGAEDERIGAYIGILDSDVSLLSSKSNYYAPALNQGRRVCGNADSIEGVAPAEQEEINGSGKQGSASPMDNTLSKQYPYKTIAELSGDTASGLDTHIGDWEIRQYYNIHFDANGGSNPDAMADMKYLDFRKDYQLTRNIFVRNPDTMDGVQGEYTFLGWNTKADGSGTSYSDQAYVRLLSNTSGATVTLYAQWHRSGFVWDFPYKEISRGEKETDHIQIFTADRAGIYRLEVWGAQGGAGISGDAMAEPVLNRDVEEGGSYGGRGGYAAGEIHLNAGDNIYVYIGGKGDMSTESAVIPGGWNGGGSAKGEHASKNITNPHGTVYLWGSGGGATHMAVLPAGGSIENYPNLASYVRDQDSVLLAAGGGGGAGSLNDAGGVGGGLTGGNGSNSTNQGMGGTQTTGGRGIAKYYVNLFYIPGKNGTIQQRIENTSETNGRFGAGGGYINSPRWINRYYFVGFNGSGGGGGWYGGGTGYDNARAAGGGSGHVRADLLQDLAGTGAYRGTLSGSNTFASPQGTMETGHGGDGYGRITLLREDAGNDSSTNSNTGASAASDAETITGPGANLP